MKWLPIAGGVVAGVIGLMLYQKHAAAAAPPAAPPAPAPSTQPKTASVLLQPGATSVGVAPSGTVTLQLPSGASWSTSVTPVSPIPATSVQPTGNQSFAVQMSPQVGNFPLTMAWVDSNGAPQTTMIEVSVA